MTPYDSETGEPLESGLDIDVLRRRREIVATIAAITLLLGATSILAWYLLRPAPANRSGTIGAAEKTVAAAVGRDYRCAFPSDEELDVKAEDDGAYTVSGRVDVISLAGRAETYTFRCTLFPTSDSWAPATLELGFW